MDKFIPIAYIGFLLIIAAIGYLYTKLVDMNAHIERQQNDIQKLTTLYNINKEN